MNYRKVKSALASVPRPNPITPDKIAREPKATPAPPPKKATA